MNPTSDAHSDLARYRAVLDDVRPRFTPNEARLLCDAFNGTLFVPLGTAGQLANDLRSIPEAERDALFKKWSVDGEQLLQRLDTLTLPEFVATVDAIERFWANADATVARVGLTGPPHEGDGRADGQPLPATP
jgi:hypothetical protein